MITKLFFATPRIRGEKNITAKTLRGQKSEISGQTKKAKVRIKRRLARVRRILPLGARGKRGNEEERRQRSEVTVNVRLT
jgi:hypothetical protein